MRSSTWLTTADLKPTAHVRRYEKNEKKERYYQRRNKRAKTSHTQTKIARFAVLGINVDHIKSCKT